MPESFSPLAVCWAVLSILASIPFVLVAEVRDHRHEAPPRFDGIVSTEAFLTLHQA